MLVVDVVVVTRPPLSRSLSALSHSVRTRTRTPHAIAAVVTKKRYELVVDVVVVTRPPLSRSLSDATRHC